MSSKQVKIKRGFKLVRTYKDISEYLLQENGLRVIYKNIPGTKVVTSNITYLVGAKDEEAGETGLAHMLEHMIFKPTTFDLKKKSEAASMKFEREVGVILNANTCKDRTTYYFSFEKSYFARVIRIEAERMKNVILSDKEFLPERTNVLSEFDMYNGDPHFALNSVMSSVAFNLHPYGHETIGFREDIEDYTADKLNNFYKKHYHPAKAIFSIVGDISLKEVLSTIYAEFKHLDNDGLAPRKVIREPKQEGLRRISINRPGITSVLAFGFKHAPMPSVAWYTNLIMLDLLTGGPASILHKKLVDKGLVTSVSGSLEPVSEMGLGYIYVNLPKAADLNKIERLVLKFIKEVTLKEIKKHLKTVVNQFITSEKFERESSLGIIAELTEFIAVGSWEAYFETEKKLRDVSAEDLIKLMKQNFQETNLTIGHYRSY